MSNVQIQAPKEPVVYQLARAGRCDVCHRPDAELFGLDPDEPINWNYCYPCAERARRRALRRRRPGAITPVM